MEEKSSLHSLVKCQSKYKNKSYQKRVFFQIIENTSYKIKPSILFFFLPVKIYNDIMKFKKHASSLPATGLQFSYPLLLYYRFPCKVLLQLRRRGRVDEQNRKKVKLCFFLSDLTSSEENILFLLIGQTELGLNWKKDIIYLLINFFC